MKKASKILYLVRHAKAAKFNSSLPDIDRPLTETGIEESYVIAGLLVKANESPQVIVSSTGARAISTALIFQRELKIPDKNFKVAGELYDAPVSRLISFVSSLDDKFDSVMLFGHNPSFTEFASRMEASIAHMPTAAVVKFEFAVESWRHCSYMNAEKQLFLYP